MAETNVVDATGEMRPPYLWRLRIVHIDDADGKRKYTRNAIFGVRPALEAVMLRWKNMPRPSKSERIMIEGYTNNETTDDPRATLAIDLSTVSWMELADV